MSMLGWDTWAMATVDTSCEQEPGVSLEVFQPADWYNLVTYAWNLASLIVYGINISRVAVPPLILQARGHALSCVTECLEG